MYHLLLQTTYIHGSVHPWLPSILTFTTPSFTMQATPIRTRGSKCAFLLGIWMRLHGVMLMVASWFLMEHLGCAPPASFCLVDERGKGIPITFFLFSAPTGNKATPMGYNHNIIWELLAKWRDHLSSGRLCIFLPSCRNHRYQSQRTQHLARWLARYLASDLSFPCL